MRPTLLIDLENVRNSVRRLAREPVDLKEVDADTLALVGCLLDRAEEDLSRALSELEAARDRVAANVREG